MRRVFTVAFALALLPASVLGAAVHQATVFTVDGQKLVGTVTDESFAIRTPYGTVTIPAEDVVAAYPGVLLGDATRKRIDQIIQRLTTANKDQAVRELTQMGRITVPQLQSAAQDSDKKLAREAAAVLKVIWPSGASVPSDGSSVIFTKSMEFRGVLTLSALHVEGSFGRKTLLPLAVRMVQFGWGKPPAAENPPPYPPLKDARSPELDLSLSDSSRVVGTPDFSAVEVETPYGKLSVPVGEIISIKLGTTDEFVTREMTFQGTLVSSTFNLTSKIGRLNINRDKVLLVKTVLNEGAAPVAAGTSPVTDQWIDLFNGKDLSNWSSWGGGSRKVEGDSIRLAGDSGLAYQAPKDIKNCIVAASIQVNSLTNAQGGVKISLRDGPDGAYYVHFSGKNGLIAKWDNQAKKSTTLKTFRADPPPDGWHSVQFGISGTLMLAYVNGQSVCEITVDPNNQLPAGRICIGTWNCDASFRQVQMKMLK